MGVLSVSPGSRAGPQEKTSGKTDLVKRKQCNLSSIDGLQELDRDEMSAIDGGGFWDSLYHVMDVTVTYFKEFTRQASAFQASLPPSLKK